MHENFFKPQYKCAAGVSTPYFKINANPFSFGCLLFSKEYLNLLIKILYFCRSLWTLSLSRNFVEFSLKLVYPIITVGGNVQVSGIKITGKCIYEWKRLNLDIFTHTLRSRILCQVLIITPSFSQRAITHSLRQHFFENLFQPSRKGGRYLILNKKLDKVRDLNANVH